MVGFGFLRLANVATLGKEIEPAEVTYLSHMIFDDARSNLCFDRLPLFRVQCSEHLGCLLDCVWA